MMTKRQYCEMIVHNVIKEKNITPEEVIDYAYSSTSLGIALEYLGFINPTDTPDLYNYLQSRGGIVFASYDEKTENSAILSMRELLDLLPEDNEEESMTTVFDEKVNSVLKKLETEGKIEIKDDKIYPAGDWSKNKEDKK